MTDSEDISISFVRLDVALKAKDSTAALEVRKNTVFYGINDLCEHSSLGIEQNYLIPSRLSPTKSLLSPLKKTRSLGNPCRESPVSCIF
jgi:hypothetical protein